MIRFKPITMFFLLIQQLLIANPFLVELPNSPDESLQFYEDLQQKLHEIDIRPLIEERYTPDAGYTTFEDFHFRCRRGIRQNLIGDNDNLRPTAECIKFGKGGDSCIVTCIPLNGSYPTLIADIIKQLEYVNFDGYLMYRIGGYPHTDVEQLKYCGVPYAFKIPMMSEAYQNGFTRVLWIDSACLPVRNPKPLFDEIDLKGAFIHGWPTSSDSWRYIFPSTRELLKDLTSIDVLNATYVCAAVFGLKMDTKDAVDFIGAYNQLVVLGYPFLSCFPEEFVFSALVSKNSAQWTPNAFSLFRGPLPGEDSHSAFEAVQSEGYFFFHRLHWFE